jgi:hypothetical protein
MPYLIIDSAWLLRRPSLSTTWFEIFCKVISFTPESRINIDGLLLSWGSTSSNRHMVVFFEGTVHFEQAERIWKSWTPQRCKFFVWLASLNRYWTTDCLARRRLEHLAKCPLYDQEEETIQHIPIQCVSLEMSGFESSLFGLQHLTPGNGHV